VQHPAPLQGTLLLVQEQLRVQQTEGQIFQPALEQRMKQIS
jgi:hypothetical protein